MAEDAKPLILVASKSLSLQAMLGDILAAQAKVISLVREQQFDYWLDTPESVPELLILDHEFMAQGNRAFCDRWVQHPVVRDVPIIIMGEDSVEQEVESLMAGAMDYLRLPVQPMVYLARIKKHLHQIEHRRMLESLSMTDALTGLANRRYFDDFLLAEWRRAAREESGMGLILADIDFFKLYNDHYGHLEGDKALKRVAEALKQSVQRPRDLVARFGGEEFVMLLPSIDAAGVEVVANRVLNLVRNLKIPHEKSNVAECLTISLGLAWVEPSTELDMTQFINAADEALYQSKDHGRDQVSRVVEVNVEALAKIR